MKYAIFKVPQRNNWMNLLPITQNELELLSSFEHSVEAAKADLAERLKSGVSVEPGPLAVDLAAIQVSRSAVVSAAQTSDLGFVFESEADCEGDDFGVMERYGPICRLLSEDDIDYLRTQGTDEKKVRAFLIERRNLYRVYVSSFEQEMLAAWNARKTCMSSRGAWDIPSLLRQRHEIRMICFKLRCAAILDRLRVPVDVTRLIESSIRQGLRLIDAAEVPVG